MSWIRSVLAAVIVALLLALASQPAHAVDAPADPDVFHGYGYDAHVIPSVVAKIAPERGPPANLTTRTSAPAVDLASYGRFSHLDGGTPADICTYDGITYPAQAGDGWSIGTEVAPGANGELSALRMAGVAANTGSRLAEASSSAFRAADNVGDFTVSAKHLPGAGGRWNKWAEGVDINGTIASALRSDAATFLPNASGAADSFIVRTNVGSIIGTKGQTYVKAVVSNDGRIITAYPVK